MAMNAKQILITAIDVNVKHKLGRITDVQKFNNHVKLLEIARFRLDEDEFLETAGKLEDILGEDA